MTREEQIVKAAKDSEKQMGFGEVPSSYGIGFLKGAIWADEHPDLYSVTRKAVERERKYLIDKACEWLNNFYNEGTHSYLVNEDIDTFRKAMEEQQ